MEYKKCGNKHTNSSDQSRLSASSNIVEWYDLTNNSILSKTTGSRFVNIDGPATVQKTKTANLYLCRVAVTRIRLNI